MITAPQPIRQKFNKLYAPVLSTKARYIHIWGGRGRGGSHFGTDYFLHKITRPEYFRGYFMREVFGDIRESLWRDFNDRIEDNETLDARHFSLNETFLSAEYLPTGNSIHSKGFKKSSSKQTAKLKSIAGATHILIEEAEENAEEDFNQLDDSLRTTKSDIQIIKIFNPPHKNHWLIRKYYNLVPAELNHGSDFKGYYEAIPKQDPLLLSIHGTYLDNLVNINETTRRNFENYRETNFEYYATIVKGLVSEGVRGVIYRDWKPITMQEFNELPFQSFYGLDFGFSNDPAALVEIKAHNDNVWLREMFYERGLTNQDIAAKFKSCEIDKDAEIYADSAEPKSIAEIEIMGWNILPAVKGPDSIEAGVKYLLSKKVHYTENSRNLIYEKDNYRYAMDANKEPTRKPEDKFNHLLDGARYGVYTKLALPDQWWGIGSDGKTY